ncbi:atonal bHLH transcription factor 8-like protein net isoform X2 [Rhodnius prolixus]
MTCTIAKIWDEEVGGRPEEDVKDEPVKIVKRKSIIPIKEDDRDKKRRCTSPFRPWTPCQEEPLPLVSKKTSTTPPTEMATTADSINGAVQRRNYKNMTRERRIEANARERTRVHTISAAFETLRKAVPAYSHTQKLSKLSVLRVAASYILTLSRVLGEDYSLDGSCPSVGDCVQSVTNAIQMEGKLKKRKDE